MQIPPMAFGAASAGSTPAHLDIGDSTLLLFVHELPHEPAFSLQSVSLQQQTSPFATSPLSETI